MSKPRFYLDENINPAVAEQLQQSGVDVVTVRDLDLLGDDDRNHLERATVIERVLCTHDQDFLRLAAAGVEHAGIVFAAHYGATIGGWVKMLRHIHDTELAEDMQNQVRYVNVSS